MQQEVVDAAVDDARMSLLSKLVLGPRRTTLYKDPDKAQYSCAKCGYKSTKHGVYGHIRRYVLQSESR